MNVLRRISLLPLLIVVLLFSLMAVACGPAATPVATQKPQPTTAPPLAPTSAPTAAPTQVLTVEPTTAPQTAATPAAKAATTSASTAAPTTGPTAQPTLTPLALGTAQTLAGLSISPVKAEQMATFGLDRPQAGNVFEVVTLNVVNTSQTTSALFNPILFILVDSSSNTHFTVQPLTTFTNRLTLQSLKPGATVTGVIVYEVPQKSTGHLSLMFKGDNNQNALWKIAG